MKAIKRRELISLLEAEGYYYESEGRHPIYRHHASNVRIAVPNGREIAPGTVRDIYKAINKGKACLKQLAS